MGQIGLVKGVFLISLVLVLFAASAFAAAPTMVADTPVNSAFYRGNVDLNFHFTDSNNAHAWISIDVNLMNSSSAVLGRLAFDANILDNNQTTGIACNITDANTGNCGFRWNSTSVLDGNYIIRYALTDSAGKFVDGNSASFDVDNNAPVTAASGTTTTWSKTNQTLILTCADDNSACASIKYMDHNNTTWASTASGAGIVIVSDGNHQIDYNATDGAGNVEASHTIYVAVDKTAPSAPTTYADVNDVWRNADFNVYFYDVNFSVSGISSAKWYLDSNVTPNSFDQNTLNAAAYDGNFRIAIAVSGLSDGNHVITTQFFDVAGNDKNNSWALAIDKTAPTRTSPDGNFNDQMWRGADFNVVFHLVDANYSGWSLKKYYIDGVGPIDINYSTVDGNYGIPIITDGNHLILANFRDTAGNDLNITGYAALDKTAPDFNVTATNVSYTVATINVLSNNWQDLNCKNPTTTDINYATNTSAASGFGTTQSWLLSNLPDGSTYTYYVQCIGRGGHDSNVSVSFSTPDFIGVTYPNTGSGPSNGPAITPLGRILSNLKKDFDFNSDEMNSVFGNALGNDGKALFTPGHLRQLISNSMGYKFSKNVVVTQSTGSNGGPLYTVTITLTVKNNKAKSMQNIGIIESIPKSIVLSLSPDQVSTDVQYSVLASDPVVQFNVPIIRSGQSYNLAYSFSTASAPVVDMANFASPVVEGGTEVTSTTNPPSNNPPATDNTGTTPPANNGSENVSPNVPAAGMDWTPIAILVVIIIVVIVIVAAAMAGKKKRK